MRLHISRSELEQGHSLQKGQKTRINELAYEAMGKRPVAIAPILNHNQQTVSAILLTGTPYDPDGKGTTLQITFRPIWCRVFRLCSMKKDQLTALVMETEDGKKYWADDSGVKECKFTTTGPGTDPEIVHKSQEVLGDILEEGDRNSVIDNLLTFVQKRF